MTDPLHPDQVVPRNHRRELVGVALFLVDEMEGDNGCGFAVSADQARRLNELAGDERLRSMTVGELETLSSGEHTDALAVVARNPELLQPIYDLLLEIFENPPPEEWLDPNVCAHVFTDDRCDKCGEVA